MFQYHHEIVDGIIDYVREVSGGHFRAPLKSCALVSKAWVPRSQFHLFHHVSLRFETEFKRWCKNITKERAKVLSTYVRWLSCSPPYKSKDKNSLERFTYFTHVETLRIFKVDFFKFKDEKVELQPAFGPFGNSTRYLVIDCCVGHFPALINLFRLLPNITHLDILHANLPYATIETDPNMRGHFGTIETLRMTGTERYFINMLMPERFTSLKHVSYFDRGPESAGDLRRLIGGCRKTVETLTVLSAYDLTSPAYDRYGRPEEYSLESCKKLREIAFDNVHVNKPNPEIVAVLPTIDSPDFTTVTFLARDANINFERPLNKYWRRADGVLAVLGKKLVEEYERKLHVVFDGWRAPTEDEDARERWRDLLPNFAQVGEITFKQMGSPPHAHDPPT